MLKYCIDQDIAAIEEYPLIERCARVSNFFDQHLGCFVEGECSVGATSIAKASSLQRQPSAVIPGVGGRFKIAETIFLQNFGVDRVGGNRVGAGLLSAGDLPATKFLRENSGRADTLVRLGGGERQAAKQQHENQF